MEDGPTGARGSRGLHDAMEHEDVSIILGPQKHHLGGVVTHSGQNVGARGGCCPHGGEHLVDAGTVVQAVAAEGMVGAPLSVRAGTAGNWETTCRRADESLTVGTRCTSNQFTTPR